MKACSAPLRNHSSPVTTSGGWNTVASSGTGIRSAMVMIRPFWSRGCHRPSTSRPTTAPAIGAAISSPPYRAWPASAA